MIQYLIAFTLVMLALTTGISLGESIAYSEIGLTIEEVEDAKRSCASHGCQPYIVYLPIAK